jgi:SSS family solute:Na+ symporter
VVAGNFGWYAFPFILLLAMVFAPRYLGARVQTLPEFMGKRFGPSTRNILAWYALVTILVSWLGLTLFAGGILVEQILDLPLWLAVVLLVMVSAFFTIAGGLKAIAYTNVFQMLLLIMVSLFLTVAGLHKAGGILAVYHQTPPNYWNLFLPMDNPNYPWLAILLGYPVMGVWFWCTEQSMVQSVLGARDLRQGQLGANFTGWLKILDVALFIIPGIVCFVLFPGLENPDEAYMTMVTRLFPAGMTGLIMAVLIAALISTIDSALNSLSTVFTMDIYVRKFKPEATPREIIRTGRIVAAAGALLAILLTLAINNIKGLNLFDKFQAVLGFLAPPMTVVFLLGVFWKKATASAANFVLSGGAMISIGIGICYLWIYPSEQYAFWPHFLLLSFLIFVVLLMISVAITLAGRKTGTGGTRPGVSGSEILDFGVIPKPGRRVWTVWIALIIVMVGMYVLFNRH